MALAELAVTATRVGRSLEKAGSGCLKVNTWEAWEAPNPEGAVPALVDGSGIPTALPCSQKAPGSDPEGSLGTESFHRGKWKESWVSVTICETRTCPLDDECALQAGPLNALHLGGQRAVGPSLELALGAPSTSPAHRNLALPPGSASLPLFIWAWESSGPPRPAHTCSSWAFAAEPLGGVSLVTLGAQGSVLSGASGPGSTWAGGQGRSLGWHGPSSQPLLISQTVWCPGRLGEAGCVGALACGVAAARARNGRPPGRGPPGPREPLPCPPQAGPCRLRGRGEDARCPFWTPGKEAAVGGGPPPRHDARAGRGLLTTLPRNCP